MARCSSSGGPRPPAPSSSTRRSCPRRADSQIFRDVVALGATLRALAPVRGQRVERRAGRAAVRPRRRSRRCGPGASPATARADRPARGTAPCLHRVAVSRSTCCRPAAALAEYARRPRSRRSTWSRTTTSRARSTTFVAGGGHVLVSYFSGIVDEHQPGARRRATRALSANCSGCAWTSSSRCSTERLSRSTTGGGRDALDSRDVEARDAEVLARFAGRRLRRGAGADASHGRDRARPRYLATRPDDGRARRRSSTSSPRSPGFQPVVPVETGLEVTRRVGATTGRSCSSSTRPTPHARRGPGRRPPERRAPRGSVAVAAGAVVVIEETR